MIIIIGLFLYEDFFLKDDILACVETSRLVIEL